MLLKHNDNQTYTFELKKKKSQPTNPIFLGHVTVNTFSFFFAQMKRNKRKRRRKNDPTFSEI